MGGVRQWTAVDYDSIGAAAEIVWPATHGTHTNNYAYVGNLRSLTVAVENNGGNAITASIIQTTNTATAPGTADDTDWTSVSSGDLNVASGASGTTVVTNDLLGSAVWARIQLTSASGTNAIITVTGERR